MAATRNKPVFSGKTFQVYDEEGKLPNGRMIQVQRIAHEPTVAIVPITAEGEIILLNQYRPALKKFLLEIPAGSIDRGESPEDAARRELAEETGYGTKKLSKLFEGYLIPGYGDEYMYFFSARDLFEHPLAKDEDEWIEPKKFTFDNCLKMMKKGKIVDIKSALGIMMCDPLKK